MFFNIKYMSPGSMSSTSRQRWCHACPESEELSHPRGISITLPPYLHIGNNTKTVFAAIYARYSTFQGRSHVSRFIPCHLRTVRTACYAGQTNRIIDNHVLSGVSYIKQKYNAAVELTTDMILATTRMVRHLRHSHLRRMFIETEMTRSVT